MGDCESAKMALDLPFSCQCQRGMGLQHQTNQPVTLRGHPHWQCPHEATAVNLGRPPSPCHRTTGAEGRRRLPASGWLVTDEARGPGV